MKNNNIFIYISYKQFIVDKLKQLKKQDKTTQKDFARALRCQPAYISQVLKSNANLSMEQADVVTHFFDLDSSQGEYFLLLVQLERAGSISLKKRIENKLISHKNESQKIAKKFSESQKIPNNIMTTFYSDWYYSAIHLMLTIPSKRTPQKIADYLGLSEKKVEEVLSFLCDSGMAKKINDDYLVKPCKFYLDKDSLLSQTAHRNWRLLELNSMIKPKSSDFHLSSIVTMSQKDIPALRSKILECVEGFREVIKDSPEEDLFCYTFDLFSLKK